MKRKIRNAFDAYYFLRNHPKLNVQVRMEVPSNEASSLEKEGFKITRDVGGKCYRIYRHLFEHALDKMDVHYVKTNKPGGKGKVDKDPSKNLYVECWLELGSLYYGYVYSGGEEPWDVWDEETMLHTSHDWDLDCGAPTFDEALIKLAKKVLKKYGDYSDKKAAAYSKTWCGKPVCADCEGACSRKDADQSILLSCDCAEKERQVCDICQCPEGLGLDVA